MPTGVTNGGSARTIGATCSGVTKRGVFSTKMKPSASAPASTAVSASSRLVMPQILTRVIAAWVGRDAPPTSPPIRVATAYCIRPAPRGAPAGAAPGRWVLPAPRGASRVHQRQLAELGGNGGDDPSNVGAGEEAALADHDRPRRDQRHELERRRDARLEGGQIAVVDPDDAASSGEGLIQLGGGVTLHERREPEPLGGGEQRAEPRRLEDGHDQEHRVGSGRARLPELVLVDREVLSQQGEVDRTAHAPQVVEAAVEILLVSEDRDRV